MLEVFKAGLLDAVRSRRIQLITLAVPLLIAFNGWLQVDHYVRRLEDYHHRVSGQETFVSEFGELNNLYEMTPAEIPPSPLSMFVHGMPARPTQHAHVLTLFSASSFNLDPYMELFSSLDLATIVMVLLSLVALFVAHDAITGEKEGGTLRLLLSNPIPRWKVITAKWGAGVVSLLPALLFGVLAAATILSASPYVDWGRDDWLGLVLLCLAATLYISAFFGLGLAVSSLTSSSGTSILMSFLLWVTLVLIIPNVGPYLAAQVRPLPQISKVEKNVEQLMNDQREKAIGQGVQEVLESYNPRLEPFLKQHGYTVEQFRALSNDDVGPVVARIRAASPEFGRLWDAEQARLPQVIEEVDHRFRSKSDQVVEDIRRKIHWQSSLATSLTSAFPASSFLLSAIELAGSGLEDVRHVDLVRRGYRDQVLHYIFGRVAKVKDPDPWSVHLGLDDRPRFSFKERAFADRLNGAIPHLALLALWNVLGFAVALTGFLRYDVR